jgi:xylulokinase
MADIFNAELVTLTVSEGAAYGAALQALWCWRLQKGENVRIEQITDEFVTLNDAERLEPIKENVKIYKELQSLQDETSMALRDVFTKHRKFVGR